MNIEYKIIQKQCEMLKQLGWKVYLTEYSQSLDFEPAVVLQKNNKTYRFSDLDSGVIMQQIATLYMNTKEKSPPKQAIK